MIKKMSKRLISWFLVVLMVVSVLPFNAFAQTTVEDEHEHEHMDINPFEETLLLKEVKAQMDEILDKYLGARDLSLEEVENAFWELSDDELMEAWDECEALRVKAEDMTDAEVYFAKLYESTQTFGYFYEMLCEIFNSDISFFASASGSHTPVTGVTVGVSGATDNSMSNGAVTVTAKGSAGLFGFGASAKTATITVYNESGETAEISFDWTASSVNELKIDGIVYTGDSGSFSKVLNAGENFGITITTAKNNTTNKLVMSNFMVVAAKAESNVTFDFDSTLGSVTVGGNAVNSGDVVTIAKEGASIVATPASGVTFLGWINTADNKIIDKSASYTLQPTDDVTVKPVFAKDSAWFLVNGNSLYEGLDAALTAVADVANKTIALANNATIPAGDYTIPAGVTLLVPFDDANTLYTSAPGTSDAQWKKPTTYRTLTLASGANITVNGAISIPAVITAAGGVSAPIGTVGMINMQEGSSIVVNSGANLYAWGFIIGSGSITVKSGATVYECFQVSNWRGGTNVSGMIDNKQQVFPMNQYYVQNIEVPMTMEAGATENGYMAVNITAVGIQGSAVPFIGPNGMFKINSGSLTKDYDEQTDRLVINIDGDISMQSLSISMKLSILGTKTINSKNYDLPVTNNITVIVNDGAKVTITQDIAILTGAELIVNKGANCILGSGNNIYIYDAEEWTNSQVNGVDAFFATQKEDVAPVKYAPGKPASVPFHTADVDAHIHIAGTIDASAGNVYVTASGANITFEDGATVKLNKPGSQTVTYQAFQNGSDGKTITYVDIPIKPIALIENDTGLAGTYECIEGAWVKTVCVHSYVEKLTTAPTCTETGLKTFTCPCGDSYTETVAATGHSYETSVTAPTCTEQGYTTHTCSACGDSYVDTYVDATGHNHIPTVTAPTCTEQGYTT
ncbi:MAG: DUF945 domain-containing protein, partial [Ruminococcaceae bacterium]|nr:DUF945 domain-containing protein [Oscillospiraceae bacterium]